MADVLHEKCDVIVVGAGHAGCEAALACARLGCDTAVFTVSVDSIALMPCNPSIGGSSKGHLVREIDALGGEMGRCIDATFLQSKMLNASKGPAVHSLRAQADKQAYTRRMRQTLEAEPNLRIVQGEVCELLTEASEGSGSGEMPGKRRVTGVVTASRAVWEARCVILASGTYLNARCLYGDVITHTGPNGLQAATHLSDSLRALGVRLLRYKTGTPARIDGSTIDYAKMEPQYGDVPVVPFSFETDPAAVQKEQELCWLTYTNETTHRIIRENLDSSPLYTGVIEGTGPRYCPSIEDKVVRFAEKDRHQIFVEPEGAYTNEKYLSGFSSSLPERVQHDMIHSVPGLEHCRIVRNAYAIEYDCVDPQQLQASLEFKEIAGLYGAGQFNGSSGYEEAAAQGLIAGINAARRIHGQAPVTLDRADAYIGVLIDDLVTKENREPYRMMTSRAEYRLLLRQDNADERLTPVGHEVGLISDERYERFLAKWERIHAEVARVKAVHVGPTEDVNAFLRERASTELKSGASLADLIRRPEIDYTAAAALDAERGEIPGDVAEEVNIIIKYEGYLARQELQVQQFRKIERKVLPDDIDYLQIRGLRLEAGQKLQKFRPATVGQASRIAGVSPADVSVLLVWLRGSGRATEGGAE
ncbi:MAG: tRNA uridine-5-carboxymethylaminomethyl(34) synthesis enzyme MnmG [Lachnospiraceae bacterium]|nr:tRNA uridine-5-carboxymethylaminomethyl(34) synthesis enzyme MnmG [Lachnospiraceae bacterium]